MSEIGKKILSIYSLILIISLMMKFLVNVHKKDREEIKWGLASASLIPVILLLTNL